MSLEKNFERGHSKDYLYREFFKPALREIMPQHNVKTPYTADYVAFVLSDFSVGRLKEIQDLVVRMSKQKNSKLPTKNLEQFPLTYIEDLERLAFSAGNAEKEINRLIGDYSLVMLGMFSGLFKKNRFRGIARGFNKKIFLERGSLNYNKAGNHQWKDMNSSEFYILSEKFESIVYSINECNKKHWHRWGDRFIADPLLKMAFEINYQRGIQ
ncbi:MAG: hypothetical protein Q8P15_02580 [Nanoarchaeota archaeon]|nr:hypothetical protein [Nanoarchaeota archaeon]